MAPKRSIAPGGTVTQASPCSGSTTRVWSVSARRRGAALRRVGVDVEVDLFGVETDLEQRRGYAQDVGAGVAEAEARRYR